VILKNAVETDVFAVSSDHFAKAKHQAELGGLFYNDLIPEFV
jgi:hypothetical protein